ncbi:M28 family peptidase [bacterium]|nr:M28 family peptidase [bacterium]
MALLLSCNEQSQADTGRSVDIRRQPDKQQPLPPKPARPAAEEQQAASGQKKDGKLPEFSRDFNKANAWRHLTKIVSFGPRVPNTKSHRACRNYIQRELLAVCDDVQVQEFQVPHAPDPLELCNIIGRINPENPHRVLILSHWDTRPICDMEEDPALRRIPNDGANDGASGNAVMLELARVYSENPPAVGVDLLFTDGEDYGPGIDMMFLGAKHFAKRLTDSQVKSYNYCVLLDMVGDTNQDFHPEYNSERCAPLIYSAAMEINKALGFNAFKTQGSYDVLDDHIPLIERGLKIYDFIDFNYPDWNKTTDTIDKCDDDSLESIGLTMENLLHLFPAIYGTRPPGAPDPGKLPQG